MHQPSGRGVASKYMENVYSIMAQISSTLAVAHILVVGVRGMKPGFAQLCMHPKYNPDRLEGEDSATMIVSCGKYRVACDRLLVSQSCIIAICCDESSMGIGNRKPR